jgi:hypothetical protein
MLVANGNGIAKLFAFVTGRVHLAFVPKRTKTHKPNFKVRGVQSKRICFECSDLLSFFRIRRLNFK